MRVGRGGAEQTHLQERGDVRKRAQLGARVVRREPRHIRVLEGLLHLNLGGGVLGQAALEDLRCVVDAPHEVLDNLGCSRDGGAKERVGEWQQIRAAQLSIF